MAFNQVQLMTGDRRLLQAWIRLNSRIKAISATLGDAGVRNVLYVSKDGNDGSATPGSLVNKYGTVQGAVNAAAALPFAVVAVGPGQYDEAVVIPDGAQNMVIVGESQYACYINAPAGSPAISVVPTQTLGLLTLQNLTLGGNISGGAGSVLRIDGSGVPGGAIFANGLCWINDVTILNQGSDPAASFISCSDLHLEDNKFDISTPGPGVFYTTTFNECSGEVLTCEVDRTLIGWSTAGVLPDGNSNRLRLTACRGALAVTDLARVELLGGYYEGSQLLAYAALLLQATDDATYTGKVVGDGTHFQWDVILGANYNNVAAPPTADQSEFSNCSFDHDVTVTNANPGVAVRHGPRMRSCTLDRTITSNDGCDLDIRGSAFEQGGLAFSGDGTIDRTETRLSGCLIQGGPGAYLPVLPVAPIPTLGGAPLPAYAANLYGVLVEPNTLDAECSWNIDPAGKTGTGINAQGFVNGVPDGFSADIVLIRR